MQADDAVAWQIHRAYARQSHLIDGGDAVGWAATFTADGIFDSPSYARPVTGTAALTAFAEEYAAAGRAERVVSRHVVSDVDVVSIDDAGTVTARAYLQIVATAPGEPSRLQRLTVLADRWTREGDAWRLQRREVRRDDRPDAGPPDPHDHLDSPTTGSDA
ncbi:nuclear transport factor 2 family protein [Nocardioides zeae]|uniref:Nuclear transport factor 2 family protein n=1 Tax=Nocardioides imazamoxiresistens TaxID=3231893 RepID=A0ABU3PUP2_9ACTN|nr:nuclear transport factor 2 family protein [Nocardioides zeae]MDT9592936.1 nuclear transport factor 2 family protein [Nocardioides zeae]